MSDSEATLPWEIDCRSLHQLREAEKSPLLIDCREPNEWELVRIEGAKLLPMSELLERVGELEPHRGQHIVVHCHHGGRSLRVAQWLRAQGFAQTQSLAGGIDQWAAEISPGMTRY